MSRKKSVLIVIPSMELGGAQKSLVSFLKGLQAQGYDKDYDIDLLIAKPAGLFMDQLPAFARRLTPPAELLWLGTPRGDALLAHSPSLRGRLGKARWILSNRQRLTAKRLNDDQRLWRNWKALLRPLPGHYDVAIAYMNGFPNYYVIDKVRAKRKILWIHNEYEKLGYDASFDRPYYEAADGVVTISDVCRESFLRVFPGLSSKVSVLANITLAAEIRSKGALAEAPEFEQADGVKILSVGRVCVQKQFELAVRAAAALKQRGLRFLWLIVGEGSESNRLEAEIRANALEACFRIIGLRSNPYSYMARCDVFVQTSRFEGKSIVLDEAKLFGKPIVITDYPSAPDAITNGENGLICPMDAEKLAAAIERAALDTALRQRFADALAKESGNDRELARYVSIMLQGG